MIQAAWQHVSGHDRESGRRAYPTYHAILRSLSEFYGAPFVQTVEAFASLSPNSDYHGNLRSCATLLKARRDGARIEDCTVTTYRACAKRAWSYLTGEVSFLDTVKGRKITSFRHNILYPETSKSVTVDGHMLAIHAGQDMTMSEANLYLQRNKPYDEIERIVRSIARGERVPVPEIQATLWLNRKRQSGVKFNGQMDLFSERTQWDDELSPDEIRPYPFKSETE